MIVGNTSVNVRATLCLNGIIVYNLFLEQNSYGFLHGMVIGNVTNDRGILNKYLESLMETYIA